MTIYQYMAGCFAIIFIVVIALLSVAGTDREEKEEDEKMVTVVYTLQITQILDNDSGFVKAYTKLDPGEEHAYMEKWSRNIEKKTAQIIRADNITCSKIQIFPNRRKGLKDLFQW